MASITENNTIKDVIERLKDMNALKSSSSNSIDHIIQKSLSEMMKELRDILHTGFDQVLSEIRKLSMPKVAIIPQSNEVLPTTTSAVKKLETVLPQNPLNKPPIAPPNKMPPPPLLPPNLSSPPLPHPPMKPSIDATKVPKIDEKAPIVASTMSTLRDEMIVELERLKKIMRGDK